MSQERIFHKVVEKCGMCPALYWDTEKDVFMCEETWTDITHYEKKDGKVWSYIPSQIPESCPLPLKKK